MPAGQDYPAQPVTGSPPHLSQGQPYPDQPYPTQPVPGGGSPTDTVGSGGFGVGGFGSGDGEGASSGDGGKRSYVPWVIGLVVVLVLGGGAVAVRAALGDSDGQPADALPSTAVAYARLDIDPSAGQKIQALRLANRFPAFGAATGLTDPEVDLRQRLFEELRSDAPGLADLDFAADVEPWLGSRIGVAVLAPEGEEPVPGFALAVQVTDQDAAEEGIARLIEAGLGSGEVPAGVAFAGDYAIFAPSQELADGYVAAAEDAPLSDDEEFRADMSALGDEGVASAWVSADAYQMFSEIAGGAGLAPGPGGSFGTAAARPVAPSPSLPFAAGSVAYALRFDDRYVELALVGNSPDLAAPADTESPIVGLPETTLFAMSLANGDEYVQQAWEQFAALAEQTGQSFEREINRFERQTGLTVPDDLSTLLGDHFTFVVDSDLGNLEDPSDLRVGALLDTDTEAAQDVIDKLVTLAGEGVDIATVDADGVLAVSTNEAYAGELTGGSLGETDAFDLAVAYGAESDIAAFFNVDELEGLDLFMEQMGEELANIAPIQAVGFSADLGDEGEYRASFRLTVNE